MNRLLQKRKCGIEIPGARTAAATCQIHAAYIVAICQIHAAFNAKKYNAIGSPLALIPISIPIPSSKPQKRQCPSGLEGWCTAWVTTEHGHSRRIAIR
jgi:hypothetical protein